MTPAAERRQKAFHVNEELRSARYQLQLLEAKPYSERAADWATKVDVKKRTVVALEAELAQLVSGLDAAAEPVPLTRRERLELLALEVGSLRAQLSDIDRQRPNAFAWTAHSSGLEIRATRLQMRLEPLEKEVRKLIRDEDAGAPEARSSGRRVAAAAR